MRHTITYSRRAKRDLVEIGLYLKEFNSTASERILKTIYDTTQSLAFFPLMGTPKPDLQKNVRSLVVEKYLVLYKSSADGVTILRVVHGARYLQKLV